MIQRCAVTKRGRVSSIVDIFVNKTTRELPQTAANNVLLESQVIETT